jgi:hypothetical protein
LGNTDSPFARGASVGAFVQSEGVELRDAIRGGCVAAHPQFHVLVATMHAHWVRTPAQGTALRLTHHFAAVNRMPQAW